MIKIIIAFLLILLAGIFILSIDKETIKKLIEGYEHERHFKNDD